MVIKLSFCSDFLLNREKSLLFIKSLFGILILRIPFYFFFKVDHRYLNFLFTKKSFYSCFLLEFFKFFKEKISIFFFRLKSRGLGYRIRRIRKSKNIFRFFFGSTFYVYFFLPKEIIIRVHKRYMLLVGSNFYLLRLIFVNLLFLRKLAPYDLRGVFFPNQIVLLKTGKKTF